MNLQSPNLRSPLSRVLGAGSAKDGTGHFWTQRVTAMGLLVLGIWFLYGMTQMGDFTQMELVEWLSSPMNSVLLMLMILTLAWHSSLGIQMVLEDYVHGKLLKTLSLVLSQFAHVFVALAAIFSILKIAFGAPA